MDITSFNFWEFAVTDKRLEKTIAIDGPAASGKTTVGLLLGKKLGYLCLDTGVFYRALTAQVLAEGVDPNSEIQVTQMAESCEVSVRPPQMKEKDMAVLVNGTDLTEQLRTPTVNRWVSEVSAYPGVRKAILNLQRQVGLQGEVILLGRDIGTVVLPDAGCKFYLTATAEERAKRRFLEEKRSGSNLSYEEILESIKHRDMLDSSRDCAPLKAAEDAFLIDSDKLNPQQVVDNMLEIIRRHCPFIVVP